MTNEWGEFAGMYAYDPFGSILIENILIDQPFRFTGREYDHSTGMYYYRARYYDAEDGRYISKDPWGMVNGPNVYIYTLNNPVTLIDPSGLELKVRIGNPNNPIIEKDESYIHIYRFPDFELEIEYSYLAKGDSWNQLRNEQLFINQKSRECFRQADQWIIQQQYMQYFYFYLMIYFKVDVDEGLVQRAKEAQKRAQEAAAAGSFINVLSTGSSFIPGVGNVAGLVGGIAGEITGSISESNFNEAIGNLDKALRGATASIEYWYYESDSWQEPLDNLETFDRQLYELVPCPPDANWEKTRGDPNGKGHDPIRIKPVITPGPGNYKKDDGGIMWDPPIPWLPDEDDPGSGNPWKGKTTPWEPPRNGPIPPDEIMWDPPMPFPFLFPEDIWRSVLVNKYICKYNYLIPR
jgi:RHS repeat-associated protein